jgi:hypothetical protein
VFTAGIDNDVLFGINADYSNALGGSGASTTGQLLTDGQMWIGSTATNAGGTHINVGTLTSPDGSLTFGYSSPNITISSALGLGRFPITPYVVGPVGLAGYQTIQAGLDAANAAGGGAVYIMPSSSPYVENLLFYDNVSVVGVGGNSDVTGSGNTVTIQGEHTPPASGYMSIKDCYLQSATSIFFSAGSGTAQIVIANCALDVANGYIWDLDNWIAPGAMIGFNNQDVGAGNNGVINNTGQATVYLQDSVKGSGAGSMIVSGSITMKNCDFNIPIEFRKNTINNIDNCRFLGTVTATVNATGIFNFSRFDPNNNGPSFVMNSTDPIRLSNCLFNTPNNPCIDGTGGGLLTLTSATFVDNSIIAGTVNVTATSAFLPASFGTTGQVFMSNGPGVVPSFQPVSSSGAVTSVSGGPGITITGTATAPIVNSVIFTNTTATTFAVDNGYFATAAGTYALPATALQGELLIVVADTAGAVVLDAPALNFIRVGSLITSSGGTVTSTSIGDSLTLRYRLSSLTWEATSIIGTWLVA